MLTGVADGAHPPRPRKKSDMGYVWRVAKSGGALAAGYAIGSAILDPRRTGRKIVSTLILFGGLLSIFLWWAIYASQKAFSIFAVLMGIITMVIVLIAISKLVTPWPFSVFRYPVIFVASLKYRTTVVWLLFLVGSLLVAIIGGFAASVPVVLIFLIVATVAVIGSGSSIISVERKIDQEAMVIRNEVARVLGWPTDRMYLGNAGSLANPEFVVGFPILLNEYQARNLADICEQRMSQSYDVVAVSEDSIHIVRKRLGKDYNMSGQSPM